MENMLLMQMLSWQVCGGEAPKHSADEVSPETLEALLAISERHDLAHIVGQALEKLGWLKEDQISQIFRQLPMQALRRYVRLNFAYEQIGKVFQEGQIPYIPLKGSVLRNYYPAPWMRTSCDIDILVHPEDMTRGMKLLQDKLGYKTKDGMKTDHDVSLFSPEGVHLELHFDALSLRYAKKETWELIQKIWELAEPSQEGSFRYCLPDALFYFYHIAHMALHFETGGCGVRALLDLWILNHRVDHDAQKRLQMLCQGGLEAFGNAAMQLSEFWFSGITPDQQVLSMGDYILRAGVYGDKENRAALGQAKMGGKLKYLIFRRVFMPYDHLKAEYPVLQKHKWLTPLYQVVRWLRMLSHGGLGRTVRELQANAQVEISGSRNVAELLEYLQLTSEKE